MIKEEDFKVCKKLVLLLLTFVLTFLPIGNLVKAEENNLQNDGKSEQDSLLENVTAESDITERNMEENINPSINERVEEN